LLARDASNRYAYSDRVTNDPGVLAYWRMDGKNGDKQIRDVKETQTAWNAENVSLGQPGAIHGDPDTAAKFNGNAGVIVAPRYQANLPTMDHSAPAGNSPLRSLSSGSFSVEAWVQLDQLNSGPAWVLSHDGGNNGTLDFSLGLNSNRQFCFNTRAGTGDNPANAVTGSSRVTQSDVDNNRWFHLVGVQDIVNNVVDLYVNGELVASHSGVAGIGTTVAGALILGGRGQPTVNSSGIVTGGLSDFFNGEIDEVAVYSRALSAQDVSQHYLLGTTGQVPEPTSLVLLAVGLLGVLACAWRRRKEKR